MKNLILVATLISLFSVSSFSSNSNIIEKLSYRYVTYQCGKMQLNYCFHLFTVSNDGSNWEKVYLGDSGCQLDRSTAVEFVQKGYASTGWNGYECN